jgi:hypothetical protein
MFHSRGKVFFVEVQVPDGYERYTIDIGSNPATPGNVLSELKRRVGRKYPWLSNASQRIIVIARNGNETSVHLSVPLQGGDIIRFRQAEVHSEDLLALLTKIARSLGWK